MSEIIGRLSNPYAMPSGGSGLASGFAMGRQIAKERGLASGVQDYVNAEANGDKAGMQKALGLMAGYAPTETMNWIQSQKKLEAVGKGMGGTESAMIVDAYLHPEKYSPEAVEYLQKRGEVLSKDPSALYNQSYQGTRGRKEAENAVEKSKNDTESVGRINRIDSLISSVESNKDLLTPTSPAHAWVGAWTGGRYGMQANERSLRGQLEREISDIKNDLIARARQHGQSGINTAREIEQATAGISSFDYAKLTGALKALKNYEQNVIGLENGMSVRGASPEQQEIIDYTQYFGG